MKLPRSPFPRTVDAPLRLWGAGAVVGCLADLVETDGDGAGGGEGSMKLHFFLNGRPVNGNASAPIFRTAVSTAGETDDDWALCPAYSCDSSADGVSINLGETPFQFPPDGLIATLGAQPPAREGMSVGVPSAAASPTNNNNREKRSRYGGSTASAADRAPTAMIGRAAERAFEAALGLGQEGRSSPAGVHGAGGAAGGSEDGGEPGSPREAGGARGTVEAFWRNKSKTPGEAADNAATHEEKRGRTKGIPGGVLAVKDATVSRCVRFDGRGWAVARRPNLIVQALDVFLLEALIRPDSTASEAASGGDGARSDEGESVVLSQGGISGFCLAIEGTKATLRLSDPEASGGGAAHTTPDGVLPSQGTWFKLSAAVARDSAQGVDRVCTTFFRCSFACLPRQMVLQYG